jgi:hypothetical protein
MNDAIGKEKKTARENAELVEERITKRSKIIVMRDHPINGWYAQVVAPSHGERLELQALGDPRRAPRSMSLCPSANF